MKVDLYNLMHRTESISMSQVKLIALNFMRSLSQIHSAGIVHRDIKSQNILIETNCSIKICDFGLARDVSSLPNLQSEFKRFLDSNQVSDIRKITREKLSQLLSQF